MFQNSVILLFSVPVALSRLPSDQLYFPAQENSELSPRIYKGENLGFTTVAAPALFIQVSLQNKTRRGENLQLEKGNSPSPRGKQDIM